MDKGDAELLAIVLHLDNFAAVMELLWYTIRFSVYRTTSFWKILI
jgi:hypothetical protein